MDHRGLFGLAWPILVTMISYSLLTLVNAIYVGWLGTSELAAIGISSSVIYLVQSFGLGWLGAVRVLVANRTGAQQPAEARALTWTGLSLALTTGLLLLAAIPMGPLVFGWMGASEAVLPLATDYFTWRVAGTPVVFLFTALQGACQGRGDTRTPMVANLLANAANLILDPLLIFGPGPLPALGIRGAALGTGLGVLLGLLFLAWRARAALGLPQTGWDRERLAALWATGSPLGMQYLMDVASYTALAALLTHAGDAHLAAHVIVVRIIMFSFLPCHAIAEATGVMVGQSLGARQPERARRALGLGLVQATSVMLALMAVFLLLPRSLVAIFGAADEVIVIAVPIIVMYACLQVLDGIAMVTYGALVGAGDTRFTLRVSLVAAWLVKLPVGLLCVQGLSLGAQGAWLGIAAEILFAVAIGLWRVRGGRWLQTPLAQQGRSPDAQENELVAVPAK